MLTDRVRHHCADVAASARHVRIDPHAEVAAGGISGLNPTLHFLEGSRADVARYVLILDAINFGSGWFGELDTTTDALTERLTAHTRERGAPWTAAELRALDAAAVGETLGLEPGHQLTRLYSAGLNHLGLFLATARSSTCSATAPRRSPSASRPGCRSSTTAASTSAPRSRPTTCTSPASWTSQTSAA